MFHWIETVVDVDGLEKQTTQLITDNIRQSKDTQTEDKSLEVCFLIRKIFL